MECAANQIKNNTKQPEMVITRFADRPKTTPNKKDAPDTKIKIDVPVRIKSV